MVACHFNFQFQILVFLKGTKELGVVHYIVDTPMANSGNGLVGGGELPVSGGGFHNMHRCQNDEVGWQRREYDVRTMKPWRKHDKWGRGKLGIKNTKDRNRFQWSE